MVKMFLISLPLMLLLLPSLTSAEAQSSLPASIQSGCEIDYPPYCYVNQKQEADGFSVELLRESLQRVGKSVTFKLAQWSVLKQELAAGKLQALPLVGRTPARELTYDFTFPYLTMHGVIVVRDETVGIAKVDDLRDKRIAVMKGDNAEEYILQKNIGAMITATSTYIDALQQLSDGKQDAVIIQQLLFTQLMQTNNFPRLVVIGKPLDDYAQRFCFAVKKGDAKLLELLNEGLSIVHADGTFRRLQEKWFAGQNRLHRNNHKLIFGGDFNYPPFEFLDDNGKPTGFNVELTRTIARRMGLSVEIKLSAWSDIRQRFYDKEIDAVQGMFYSPDRAKDVLYSPNYLMLNHCIATRKNSSDISTIEKMRRSRVIVMARDIMHDWAIEQGLENSLILAPTQEEALRLLSEGGGDCALVAQTPAYFWIQKNKWDNLRIGSTPIVSPEYCYVTSRDNQALIATLAEGLSIVKNTGEYHDLQVKWLSPYENNPFGLRKVLGMICVIVLPLLALLAFFLLWTGMLKRKVRQAKDYIVKSEERWRVALNGAGDGVWDWDLHADKVYFSPRWKAMLSIPESVTLESISDWKSLIHLEDQDSFWEHLSACRNGEKDTVECKFRMRYAANDYRWAMARGTAIKPEGEKNPERIIGTQTDIDAFVRITAALRESERRLQVATSAASLGVWDYILYSDEMIWDRQMFRIYGYDGSSTTASLRLWTESLHPDDKESAYRSYEAALRGDSDFLTEFRIVRPSGDIRNIQAAGTVLRNQNGDPERMIGVNRDITDEKNQQEQLHQLEKMNSLGQLAGGIAHDFNNQLAGIISCGELLKRRANDSFVDKYLNLMISAAQHAANLNRQLLAFARKGQYQKARIDVHALILDLCSMLERSIDKRIIIEKQLNAELAYICGDISQIQNALLNLALNARDAMPNGGTLTFRTGNCDISTTVQEADQVTPGDSILIEVTDTGCGFSDEAKRHLFEPFFTTKPLGKGTGMGLPAVLGTIQHHGGALEVHSQPNSGTTIQVRLPLSSDPDIVACECDAESLDLSCINALIIDDESVLLEVISCMLKDWQCSVHCESSGRAAISYYREHASEINVVLLDAIMPEISGAEVLQELLLINPTIHVIIISGYSDDSVVNELVAKGACGFLAKPFHEPEIVAALSTVNQEFRSGLRNVTPPVPEASRQISHGTILVVDDESLVRDSMQLTLEAEGYFVVTATNGQEAVEFASSHRNELSLIILDMVMPIMDGYTAFTLLREIDPKAPILISSGYSVDTNTQVLLNSPNTGFIHKPFTHDQLFREIEKLTTALESQ